MRNLGRASFEKVLRVSSPNSLQRSKESRPRTVLGFLEYRQTLHSGFLSERNRSQNPRERTIEGLSVSEYQSSNVNPNFKTDSQAFSRSYGRKRAGPKYYRAQQAKSSVRPLHSSEPSATETIVL